MPHTHSGDSDYQNTKVIDLNRSTCNPCIVEDLIW